MRIEGMGGQVPSYEPSSTVSVDTRERSQAATNDSPRVIVKEDDSQGNSAETKKQLSDNTIKQAVADINRKMNNTVAEFGYHEGTNRVTIRIKDKETNEVIRELPPEKTLEMIEKAWELAGILVDEKR